MKCGKATEKIAATLNAMDIVLRQGDSGTQDPLNLCIEKEERVNKRRAEEEMGGALLAWYESQSIKHLRN